MVASRLRVRSLLFSAAWVAAACVATLATAAPPKRPAAGPPEALTLPAIFSDHMVLQRQVPVPVWGRTKPGQQVTVKFMGQSQTATAGPDGRWMVKLAPLEAEREPQELVVADTTGTKTFSDVLVGEVWFGCGQSNMEFGWTFSDEFKKVRAAREKTPEKADDPNYMGGCVDAQTMKVLRRAVGNPLIRVSAKTRDHLTTPGTGWVRVDDVNLRTLPALAGCIAVYLQEELDVPVGIIVRAVSSTHMARWITEQGFFASPLVQRQIAASKAAGEPTPTLTGTAAGSGFGNLYADYVAATVPYAIRGVLWDQGEQGIGYRGVNWAGAMHGLVTSWRAAWGLGDLPWSATDHYPNELEAQLEKAGLVNFKVAKTDGLSRLLHPLNNWQYAQKHLDNIFPMVYGRPAPTWPAPQGGKK
jgi:sialate O-acetylesterase